MKTKQDIRKETVKKLEAQNKLEKNEKSLLIKEKLFALPEFKKAKIIMFYVSTEFEVDTRDMIDDALAMGKKVAVPCVFENEKGKMTSSLIKNRVEDLVKGPYEIYQPSKEAYTQLSSSEIELVVVPGVAFTKDGVRLGRGAGFYDRFLKGISKETCTIGIAFDLQVVSGLPHGEHDVPVDKIITETS